MLCQVSKHQEGDTAAKLAPKLSGQAAAKGALQFRAKSTILNDHFGALRCFATKFVLRLQMNAASAIAATAQGRFVRNLKIATSNLAASRTNGCFSRRAAALNMMESRRLSCCERVQHEIKTSPGLKLDIRLSQETPPYPGRCTSVLRSKHDGQNTMGATFVGRVLRALL